MALLTVDGLEGRFGSKQIVFDVDLNVAPGEVVGIIGHNGAGKSPRYGRSSGCSPRGGKVIFRDKDMTGASCRKNVMVGMSLIPSERFVFADQTVRGPAVRLPVRALGDRPNPADELRAGLVPILADRHAQKAGTLSGGQQRMLALGMSLMADPKLLLLDEPSLGIAPALATTVFDTLKQLASERELSILIVEQNVGQLLRIVDRVYVMRSGRFVLEESVEPQDVAHAKVIGTCSSRRATFGRN